MPNERSYLSLLLPCEPTAPPSEVPMPVNCSWEFRAGRHLTPEDCRIVSCVKASTELWVPLLSSFLSLWSSLEMCGCFNIDPLSFLRIQRLGCHPVTVRGLFTLVYVCSSLELAHTVLTITSREFCLESICICFAGTFGI